VKILMVFNNNVVLARDESGREVVLTGRGLGFQRKPGQDVDPARIVRTFVPAAGADPKDLAAMLAQIPPEHIALAVDALALATAELGTPLGTGVVVALADHLSFAITRVRRGLPAAYPLRAEVAHLYPRELAVAHRIVALVNERAAVELPPDEAVPITLHLVNAGFATADLSRTFQMTAVFEQIFRVIESAYDRPIDRHGISAARFVTHLRYFFVRMHQGAQLDEHNDDLVRAIRHTYPQAHQCAEKVRSVLELRLGQPITEDEVAYLTLHVARLTLPETANAAVTSATT